MDRFTDMTTMICTFLAFFIPFIFYKVNQFFHRNTDPPWKSEE